MSDAGWAQAWGQSMPDSAEGVRAAAPLPLTWFACGRERGKGEKCQHGNISPLINTAVFLIRWPGKPTSRTMNSNQKKVDKSRNEKVMR